MTQRKLVFLALALTAVSLACSLPYLGNLLEQSGDAPDPEPSATPRAQAPSSPTVESEPDSEVETSVEIPYPLLEDARNLDDFFGLYSYTTDFSVAEIVEFYKQELPALDFTLSNEVVGADFAILKFDPPDDHPITLNVITNDQGEREVRLTE